MHSSVSTWIIDSGVTDHFTCSFSLLSTPVGINSTILLPNGNSIGVSYKDTVVLDSNIILKDVLYVPSFKYNLISVSRFTHDNNDYLLFLSGNCLMQDQALQRLKMIGKLDGSLYKLNFSSSPPPVSHNKSINVVSQFCSVTSDLLLWHSKLGHLPPSSLKLLFSEPSFVHSNKFHCAICHKAKQAILSFPISTIGTSQPFELVYFDV